MTTADRSPITSKVVGVTFVDGYPDNLHRLHGAAADAHPEPLPAVLIREPDNPHDRNAVAVHVPSVGPIGHLPRSLAARLAPELDDGRRWRCSVVGVFIHSAHPERPGIDVRLAPVEDGDDG